VTDVSILDTPPKMEETIGQLTEFKQYDPEEWAEVTINLCRGKRTYEVRFNFESNVTTGEIKTILGKLCHQVSNRLDEGFI